MALSLFPEEPVVINGTGKKEKKRRGRPPKNQQKVRPTRILPTDRITFSRQLDLLRAWAVASGPGNKSAGNVNTANIVKMQTSTISLANPFFCSVGLLQKGEGGFTPCAEVMAFNRAYEWNKETASQKLGPVIAESWFGKALMPRLSFSPLEVEAALGVLVDECHAQPEYKNQLKLLLDYMEAAGLVQREGNQLRAVRSNPDGPVNGDHSEERVSPKPESREIQGRTSVSTTFSQPTLGIVNFHVDVKVDMEEFSSWPADRIAAFFSGIAQVLAAKAKIEKQAAE